MVGRSGFGECGGDDCDGFGCIAGWGGDLGSVPDPQRIGIFHDSLNGFGSWAGQARVAGGFDSGRLGASRWFAKARVAGFWIILGVSLCVTQNLLFRFPESWVWEARQGMVDASTARNPSI